ncbi:hypothetical protein Rhow_008940 [Rhodococcus wratislaviensis]|uniref:Uncharacterized protein n=1 Tax=Rhodococcus wratislaviensis TaxID=44752 RepID=A0A402CLY4_RHOWR|nr:hypothetical protein Rhow_008940 [Rhodococcus wratislaviensis]
MNSPSIVRDSMKSAANKLYSTCAAGWLWVPVRGRKCPATSEVAFDA